MVDQPHTEGGGGGAQTGACRRVAAEIGRAGEGEAADGVGLRRKEVVDIGLDAGDEADGIEDRRGRATAQIPAGGEG
jgi:hypothetical protein